MCVCVLLEKVKEVKAVTKGTKCLSYVDDDDDIVSKGKLTADNG